MQQSQNQGGGAPIVHAVLVTVSIPYCHIILDLYCPAAAAAATAAAAALRHCSTHTAKCSEVSACQARISALESELAAAAADNSSRLSEQQKAFQAKLEQLRQVHSQQLAAAAETAAAEVRVRFCRGRALLHIDR